MSRILILITALLSFFIFAEVAFAQSLANQPDPIQFLVAPEVPAPGDAVIIEAQGIGTFLGDSTITWQLNGKTALSGLGERKFDFTMGPLGTQASLHIIINSPSKGIITKDFTFLPSLVNMMWEAGTTVPPWYRGKALYSAGSPLTVIAFPQVVLHGATVSANNLTFNWKRNNTPLPQSSGKGRSSITIAGNQLFSGETLSVDVTANGTTLARGEITVPASAPQLVLYQKDPLRGVLYDTALIKSVTLADKEITLQAEPYFFAKESLADGSLSYAWTLNGNTIAGPDTSRGILTLRQSGSGAGSAALGVQMQNTDPSKFVQSAATALQILFGGQTANNSSFFGI